MIRAIRYFLRTRAVRRSLFKNRSFGKEDYLFYLAMNYEAFLSLAMERLSGMGSSKVQKRNTLAFLLAEIGEKVAYIHLDSIEDELYMGEWLDLTSDWYSNHLYANKAVNNETEFDNFNSLQGDYFYGAYYKAENNRLNVIFSELQMDHFTYLLFFDDNASKSSIDEDIRFAKLKFDDWVKYSYLSKEIIEVKIPQFVQALESIVIQRIRR